MAKVYLIDGYNVLRRVYGAEAEGRPLEEARRLLESRLRVLCRSGGAETRVVVVYDGRGGLPAAREGAAGGIEVRFSRPPRNADAEILDLARDLASEHDVVVVSSDRMDVGNRLAGLGCSWWSAERLARHLEDIARKGRRRSGAEGEDKPQAPESEGDVEAWLRDFGLHPEEDTW